MAWRLMHQKCYDNKMFFKVAKSPKTCHRSQQRVISLRTKTREIIEDGEMMNSEAPLHIPREELARICAHYQVRELALFGSVLRREHFPDSDIDLLVSFQPIAKVTFGTLARIQRFVALNALFLRPEY